MKVLPYRKRSPSTNPRPTRNAAVPAPPARPVVSVSRQGPLRAGRSRPGPARRSAPRRCRDRDVEAAQGRVAVERLQAGVASIMKNFAALVSTRRPSRTPRGERPPAPPAGARARARRVPRAAASASSLQPLLEAQAVAGRPDQRALHGVQVADRPPAVACRRRPFRAATGDDGREGSTHRPKDGVEQGQATSFPAGSRLSRRPHAGGKPSRHGQAAISDRLSASSRECRRVRAGSESPMPRVVGRR